ncbi:PD-(D/E)XK nuclease family protein [Patescibacteria group bacterium]|nr:PD-(D/E)XK nuclease family protein [Patescibacteria group bacterium]MBU4453192.1 PD-(D/E)XK nuclease family protein [Patescibacteria group bacterium]MCG2687233.1 PD-(D/E)XK nuclease family protein [Candidatus Parcubacteria bacterium]
MSQYYTAKRTRNIYSPDAKDPFRLSRSKIDLFLECPRCFYLDRRLGIGRPPGFPFNLNTAVDTLLKKEFDMHRADQAVHPLMKQYKIDAVPYKHEMMDEWRENFKGVQYHHKKSGFIVTGAVDDIWENPKGELIVVDYKATAKEQGVGISAPWQIGYKRQMEVYQWLLRKSGFKVNKTGYFVYCNGRTDRTAFDGKLEFDVEIFPYKGDPSWVEPTLLEARDCLSSDAIPDPGKECDYCAYRRAAGEELQRRAGVQVKLI